MMRRLFVLLYTLHGLFAAAQSLTNATNLNITKTWWQVPNGYTYTVAVRVPQGTPPNTGFPVCILLHGNGGNPQQMIGQFKDLLSCHVLVAPLGYMNSWNICSENSDGPDVEMLGDLILSLKNFTNIDTGKIRLLGSSNGGALVNRMYIENSDPAIDRICAVVSQLHDNQFRSVSFFQPQGNSTDPSQNHCGYDLTVQPSTGRRYLSICNTNDFVIPYLGGPAVGLNFLDAEYAAFVLAQDRGYIGSQLSNGVAFGTPSVSEFSYLSGKIVHLKGDAGHGVNATQLSYIRDFFSDCLPDISIDAEASSTLRARPNPVQKNVQIEGLPEEYTPYQLIDKKGKPIRQGTTAGQEFILDLSELPAGSYLFQAADKQLRIIKR
jgi:poly(3-hydroxybutyrate) depolymerase